MLNRNPKYQPIQNVADKYLTLNLPGFSAATFYAACWVQKLLPFHPLNPKDRYDHENSAYLDSSDALDRFWLNTLKPILDGEIEQMVLSVTIDPHMVYMLARKIYYLRVTKFSDPGFILGGLTLEDSAFYKAVDGVDEKDMVMALYYVSVILRDQVNSICNYYIEAQSGEDLDVKVDELMDIFTDLVEADENPSTYELKQMQTVARVMFSRTLLFSYVNATFKLSMDPLNVLSAFEVVFKLTPTALDHIGLVLFDVERNSSEWENTVSAYMDRMAAGSPVQAEESSDAE